MCNAWLDSAHTQPRHLLRQHSSQALQVLSNSEVEDALGAKAIAELMLEVDSCLAAALNKLRNRIHRHAVPQFGLWTRELFVRS